MAREYKGTSQKAERRYKYDSRPGFIDNGGLNHLPHTTNWVGDNQKPRPTMWTEEADPMPLSSERTFPEGKPVTPREYIEDYHQRGYYAPITGEVRVLEKVGEGDYERNERRSSAGGEKILNQLKKAKKRTK